MKTATSILRLSPELEQIRFDAMRYCDERDLRDEADLKRVMAALAQKAFFNAIEPYTKAKADMVARGLGRILMHADGTIEHIPEPLSPEAKSVWDQLDEMIEGERRRYTPPA